MSYWPAELKLQFSALVTMHKSAFSMGRMEDPYPEPTSRIVSGGVSCCRQGNSNSRYLLSLKNLGSPCDTKNRSQAHEADRAMTSSIAVSLIYKAQLTMMSTRRSALCDVALVFALCFHTDLATLTVPLWITLVN